MLPDEEYRELQATLVNQPDIGPVIPKSGGIRKMRWGIADRGKSGGARIIYYWATTDDKILMLLIYAKNESEDLTSSQIKLMKEIVEKEFP